MRIFAILFLALIFISLCCADCEDGQVDINSASLEELDKIIWVGPATAEKIINSRPFENLDSLIKVSGIGEIKLKDIKEQGIACVEEEKEENKEKQEEKQNFDIGENLEHTENLSYSEENNYENLNKINSPINISPKDIKKQENNKNNSNLAFYGFIAFSVLIVLLFILQKNKSDKKKLV